MRYKTIYNYCFHMRWTSKVVTLSRFDNLMFTSSEGNNCFIIPNIFKTWMFYFVEDNKIIFGFKKYNCETGLKKRDFQHTSWLSSIVDLGPRATTYCLLSHYVCYVNLERLVTNFITYYSVQTLQVKEKNLIPKYCFNRSNALKLS